MYELKGSGSMTFDEVVDNNCNSQILQIFIVGNKDDFENTNNNLLMY